MHYDEEGEEPEPRLIDHLYINPLIALSSLLLLLLLVVVSSFPILWMRERQRTKEVEWMEIEGLLFPPSQYVLNEQGG